MVEAGAKEVSEEEMLQALEQAHAAIKDIVAGIDALAKEAGQEEDRVRQEGDRPRRSTARSRRRSTCRSPRRCGSRTSWRTTARVDQVLAELDRRAFPKARSERRAEAKAIFKELKEKVMRDEALERGKRLDGRALRRDPADHDRSRRAAARPRLGASSRAAKPRRW